MPGLRCTCHSTGGPKRRHILSLDKDRANLQTLLEALQEEKGLLQTQISVGDRSYPRSSSGASEPGFLAKADAGTSTDDHELEISLTLGQGSATGKFEPLEQQQRVATIGSINNLITEVFENWAEQLAEEKEALLKALRAESVGAVELRALNAELSHKLEVQTQRLELAVAQSMANDSTPRPGSTYAVSRISPEYIDEEDEVVDRVLGWIIQLFPSGSSRCKRL